MLVTGWSFPELMALPEGYRDVLVKKLREQHQAEGRAARRGKRHR